MHYYQFHIGDYRSSTTHLTNEEDLCYRRLIDFYMDTELPIPLETQWVARRIRIDTHVVDSVLKDFFILGENGWIHDVCEVNLKKYQNRANVNKINGLKVGRPKAENPMGSESKPKRTLTNNHKPITINHNKEKINKKENYTEDFEVFWKAYPRKVGKQKCQAIWIKKKPPLDLCMQALQWQIKSDNWVSGFIPNPETYLNQGRWEDEPPRRISFLEDVE